jgi:glycosyltransferase involved in cell wall biosynthesis
MAAAFRVVAREHRFDVVEMPECGAEGLFLDAGPSTATVVKLHSPAALIMEYYDVRRLDRALCSRLERRALERAVQVFSGSRFLARQARSRLGWTGSLPVVPNGIDVSLFAEGTDGSIRRRLGLPADRPLVLMPGRIERRKGAHLAPAIMTPILREQPVLFVLAGRDLFGLGEHGILPALSGSSCRGSVHALGPVSPTDLHALLAEAAVVLLPSLWENCPYACLEAMAAGRPVVASDTGGLPELITPGETGLLVPAGDTAGFSAAVACLLADPVWGEELGRRARAVVCQRFSHLEVARRTVSLYQEVLS